MPKLAPVKKDEDGHYVEALKKDYNDHQSHILEKIDNIKEPSKTSLDELEKKL
jgi:hypothetical protein